MKSFKDQSRIGWADKNRQETVSLEDIRTGALQRIADATELMASNYATLQNEAENYKKWYKRECESNRKMARRIAALQGVITKMKKKTK